MDFQVALIGLGVFVVSGAILLFISMFGIKQKSYEEAMAEKRQAANQLLSTTTKIKHKETNKKQKKANKKVKEKSNSQTVSEKENNEDSENTESTPTETMTPEHHANQKHSHLHVEFKEPSIIVVDPTKEITPPTKVNQGL